MPPLLRELDWTGSDVDHFTCPRCAAHDRERHLFMYLNATGLLAELSGKCVVHFAPEQQLSLRIAASRPAQYLRCDLHPRTPEIQQVNILSTGFDSESIDVVIANHVLEHVADDRMALTEIRRTLKVGGYAILQTPYAKRLHFTWEDPGITQGSMRLQAYGQPDHVRLYGSDIFDRFASAGLESRVHRHQDILADLNPVRLGVNEEEPFFLFQRAR